MVELVYKFNEKFVFTLLPARASEQGKVIGFGVHIYIYIYIYIYICLYTRKWFPLQGELASFSY